MTLLVFIIGPAGAGKSTFTSSFRDWLKTQEAPVLTFNLDPAVENMEYLPDIDVREYVFVRDILEKYGLGPNGAIIASMDMVLEHLGKLEKEFEDFDEGYILIDTPGQMEIFVFRKSGEYIVNSLCSKDRKCAIIFLMDSIIVSSPSDFISQLFMAASVFYRFKYPLMGVFSKVDLLSPEEKERIRRWIEEESSLERDVEKSEREIVKDFSRKMLRVVSDFKGYFPTIMASSTTFEGFEHIYSYLQQIYMGGEDFEKTTKFVEDIFQ
ncbi:MAG: GTPase [Thermoprotei archaeon]|nr:MAG: GTPase [Thermoprotei archaeon]